MILAGAVTAVGVVTVGYLAGSAVQLTVGTVRTAVELRRGRQTDLAGTAPAAAGRYLILLPMLREDRLVAATCRHFLAFAAQARMRVVVVTCRAEAEERADAQARLRGMAATGETSGWQRPAALAVLPEALPALGAALAARDTCRVDKLLSEHLRPTTAEVAEPTVERLNVECGRAAFAHVEVDAAHNTKVAKLNAALADQLSGALAGAGDAAIYVAVYDADSAPDPATIGAVDAELARRKARGMAPPSVFQQVSCYCRNLPSLTGVRGVFALADAIAQTRWALGFEYPLFSRYSAAVRRGRTRPLAYCIGHGCFVSLEFLRRTGGFPRHSPTDDLALGYLASALGAEIAPIPAMDFCGVAPDPIVSMRQSRFWFRGSARFWRDLREADRCFGAPLSMAQRVRLHVDGFGRNAAWAGRGPAWLAAVILAVGTSQWWLAVGLVAAQLLYAPVGFAVTLAALRRLPGVADTTGLAAIANGRLVAAGGASCATFVLRSLGPFSGSLRGVGRRAGGAAWKHER